MDDELKGSQDERISSLWSSLDTQGGGQLDAKALRRGLKKLDHREYEHGNSLWLRTDLGIALKNADNLLNEVIKAVDTNNDGRIEYSGAPRILGFEN